MFQEKREEEDLPALKTVLTHRYNDSKTIYKKHEGGLITATRNETENTMNKRMTITRKQKWEGKQLYERFKRLINNIIHDKTWTWLRKGNFMRETESLLIAAQDNAVRNNHIKAGIDETQQISKFRLCGERDETINHISECSKLAQKEYKTRHDWVGKVIDWEMCKTFKCDQTNKWYMHNPAPVLENDTHKLLWDFSIHTDHLISTRRPDLIIINKKKKRTCKIVDFAVPADHRIKLKVWEKKDKYLDLARELKKLWNMQVTIIPIVIGAFGTVTKGLLKGLQELEVSGRGGYHPNDSIIENSQNPEKSPGDLRILAVPLIPVKNNPQTLM